MFTRTAQVLLATRVPEVDSVREKAARSGALRLAAEAGKCPASGSQEGSTMGNDRSKNDATKEYLELANRCLIEASRTLDREAAHTLRHLVRRYFKEADR
jgi:hypothetical protein